MSNRERLLSAAIIVWIVLMVAYVGWRLSSGPRPPTRAPEALPGTEATGPGMPGTPPSSIVPPPSVTPTPGAPAGPVDGSDPLQRLAALTPPVPFPPPVEIPAGLRNPFAWPASLPVNIPPVATAPPAPPASETIVAPIGSAPPPLSFAGRFVTGRATWVLLRNGSRAYLVSPGHTVPGRKARLVSATDRSATLADDDGGIETVERHEPVDTALEEVLARLRATNEPAWYPLTRTASGPELPPGLGSDALPGRPPPARPPAPGPG